MMKKFVNAQQIINGITIEAHVRSLIARKNMLQARKIITGNVFVMFTICGMINKGNAKNKLFKIFHLLNFKLILVNAKPIFK